MGYKNIESKAKHKFVANFSDLYLKIVKKYNGDISVSFSTNNEVPALSRVIKKRIIASDEMLKKSYQYWYDSDQSEPIAAANHAKKILRSFINELNKFIGAYETMVEGEEESHEEKQVNTQ